MQKVSFIFYFLTITFCFPQQTIVELNKAPYSDFILDGIISDSEIDNAKTIDIVYEHEPGYNTTPSYETKTYLKYTDTYLYVGFRAYRDEVKADIHPRDNFSLFEDDFANIHLDTYGDARNNIGLTSNLFGSQADGIRIDTNDWTRGNGSGWSLDANFEYQSLGRYTDFGYEVEFIIPFSSIPFPMGKVQRWKIKLSTYYRDNTKQGVTAQVFSSKLDRDNSCMLCQNNHTIVMSDIKVDRVFNLLPYVGTNIIGNREKYYDRVNYETPKLNYGLGINLDLNKNLSIEGTINPDFSQVEADVTKIDINSPTAINYPEKRPFFNRGIDLFNYSLDVFYTRSINNPSFASKILNQGKKSRLYVLSAVDKNSPYLVPTHYESFSGVGGKSFNNVIRYEHLVNQNTRFGGLLSNRLYEGDAYGNLIGLNGIINFSRSWKIRFEFFKNSNQEPVADWIDSEKTFADYTVKLDGEKFAGHAFYSELRRETLNWRSFIRYTNISPTFRSDLGFITQNDVKKYEIWHGYYSFPNTQLIKNYRLSAKYDREYNYDNSLKMSAIQAYFTFLTVYNTNVFYNYEYDFYNSHLMSDFKDYINHYSRLSSRPFEFMDIQMSYAWGKDIAYREAIPKLGIRSNLDFKMAVNINNNLRLTPSINFEKLKKIDSEEYFFDGYIARLDFRYQFNTAFNFRVISEYNEFSDKFFVQPLISWRPNPDTIFYFGGNQNYVDEFIDYNSPNYMVNKTQLFLKFQYLIKS